MIDKELLQLIACPSCKEKLFYSATENQLICNYEGISFPITDHIPQLRYRDTLPTG